MHREESSNPYESPIAIGAQWPIRTERKDSYLRGALMAMILGAFGFCIIYGVKFAVALFAWRTSGSFSDLKSDLLVGFEVIPGAVILGFVFGSAAWANYFPARGLGFVRCLLLIGGGTVIWGVGAALIARILGIIEPKRRGPPPLSHLAFFTLVPSIAPCAIGYVLAALKHTNTVTGDAAPAQNSNSI
jgi:hypothetical protein